MQERTDRQGGKAAPVVFLRTVMLAGVSTEGGEGSRLTLEGDDGMNQPSHDIPLAGKACARDQASLASRSSSDTVADPIAALLIQ